jgi:hypothetical protein
LCFGHAGKKFRRGANYRISRPDRLCPEADKKAEKDHGNCKGPFEAAAGPLSFDIGSRKIHDISPFYLPAAVFLLPLLNSFFSVFFFRRG